MKSSALVLTAAATLGCGRGVSSHPGEPEDAAAPQVADAAMDGARPTDAPTETHALAMSDITMLIPRPFGFGDAWVATMNNNRGNGTDFIPRGVFAHLVTAHGDFDYDYEDFQVFSVRFDLCDRVAPGPCPRDADGSLRVVFQPLVIHTDQPADVGLHAFYRIPAADLAAAVNELRKIAREYDSIFPSDALDVHGIRRPKGLIPDLLAHYALADRLIRLSVMGQDSRTNDLRIVFRSVEVRDGQAIDMPIPTLGATEQVVTLADVDPSYIVSPVVDVPAGLALALSSGAFNSSPPEEQRASLDILVATQNPLLHTASTVQCITCHLSTYLGVHRGQVAGIEIRTLPSRYTTLRDVRVSRGISASNERALHGFSWLRRDAAISQRVANETAQVLAEIDERFPVSR